MVPKCLSPFQGYPSTKRRQPNQRGIGKICRSSLTSISPLDGRYANRVDELRQYFSELALMDYRVRVEAQWALILQEKGITCAQNLGEAGRAKLEELAHGIDEGDARRTKELEASMNHDVKAVEYFVKEKLLEAGLEKGATEAVHFGCTSEDLNNLAHGMAVKNCLQEQILPEMDRLIDSLCEMAVRLASVTMLSRTHGQAASPTTMGRELSVFAYRLKRQREELSRIQLLGKMAGAVGTYSAHMAAEPGVHWEEVAREFVHRLGLEHNPLVTQIEPHDCLAEVSDAVRRFNAALLDLDRDLWGYISLGYFRQRIGEGEVGSSTMPHKVNPIDFENSEGNIGVANSLFAHLGEKLQCSRFQRDLSDSTALRNVGVAFGHSLLAYKSTRRGLAKLEAEEEVMKADLSSHWELLGEAVQTSLRKHNVEEPYEQIKEATQGKRLDAREYSVMLDDLPLPEGEKERLRSLTPDSYVGAACEQAECLPYHLSQLESWRHHLS